MKVLTGHLTATEKTHINAILDKGLMCGTIGKKTYHISKEANIYTVIVSQKDRGLIPCAGSKLRVSQYKHTFTINN